MLISPHTPMDWGQTPEDGGTLEESEDVVRWLRAMPRDVWAHFARYADVGGGSSELYPLYALCDEPELDRGTAQIMFWRLLQDWSWAPDEEFDDPEHGTLDRINAVRTLATRLSEDRFVAPSLRVWQSEIDDWARKHHEVMGARRPLITVPEGANVATQGATPHALTDFVNVKVHLSRDQVVELAGPEHPTDTVILFPYVLSDAQVDCLPKQLVPVPPLRPWKKNQQGIWARIANWFGR